MADEGLPGSRMRPLGPASFERLHLADEPLFLLQIRKLKLQLEEERQTFSRNDGTAGDLAGLQNGSDLQFIEMQSRYWEGTGQSLSVCRLCPRRDCKRAASVL